MPEMIAELDGEYERIAELDAEDELMGYREHVARVVAHAQEMYGQGSLEAFVALYHDAVEDKVMRLDQVRAELEEQYKLESVYVSAICAAVSAITRKASETYAEYIERVAKDPLARRTKLADLEVNMFLSPTPPPGDLSKRYAKAIARLKAFDPETMVPYEGCSELE